MKITFDVRSIMTRNLVTIEDTAVVSEAVALMGGRDVGAVVVTRGGEPVGVLTERDVMRGTLDVFSMLGSL